MTAREIVETALGLLRRGYVSPDLAERAATAIEVRLAACEYDGRVGGIAVTLAQVFDQLADPSSRAHYVTPGHGAVEPVRFDRPIVPGRRAASFFAARDNLRCGLRPPKLEHRNGADSSSLAFVIGKAWVAPRLLGVDAVAFSAGQFADGYLVCLGSAFDIGVTRGGQVVVPGRVGGCSTPGCEDVDDVRLGVVPGGTSSVDVLPPALAAAVMHQDQRSALEGPANPALVRPELRDGLRVPVERLAHVELLSFTIPGYALAWDDRKPVWWGVYSSRSTLGLYMDRKGLKRGTPLPAVIAVSSALGSPRSSLETDPVAKIAFMRSPTCAVLDDSRAAWREPCLGTG
jgi:hypothetical protein